MIPFKNSYARLPKRFHVETQPAKVPLPTILKVNRDLANELGIDPDWLESDQGLAILSGNEIAEGSQPIALAYGGHQFGGWVPQLGDGRAVLLGEVIHSDDKPRDIQLKGSGRTHFSRGGDGKATLGSVIREYLMSEAMHALGVPTTRALAAVTTGEKVFRETPLDGAIFTRVASSHIRVGTFQYFAAQQDNEALEILVKYALERHYPEALEHENPALALLENVITAQAELVSHWMSIGFIHGVMNTDNSSISGETIDYGPCAFMDNFHPNCVFSAIDRDSRYAWGNQASIAHWNLMRLAETLIPLIDPDKDSAIKLAESALKEFSNLFQKLYHQRFCHKYGINTETPITFIQDSLAMLAEQDIDFTLFFRHLTQHAKDIEEHSIKLKALFNDPTVFDKWLEDWNSHHDSSKISQMGQHNPVLIPRNHQVERAIQDAIKGDFSTFHQLTEAWKTPYSSHQPASDLELAPEPHERVTQTFCGT